MTISKKQIQSEQTRQRIINAAIEKFSMQGFNYTSISDLAKATGITKGAIYHHFENKNAIFYAVLENIRNLWKEKVLRDLIGKSGAIDRLSILFDNHAKMIAENENICVVLSSLVMEMDNINDEFMSELKEIFADLTLIIERIIIKGQENGEIRSDLDPKLVALNIIGMMEGSAIPWKLNRASVSYKTMNDVEKQILIDGLKA